MLFFSTGLYGLNFSPTHIFAAYERLILYMIKGDHNLFVRKDEVETTWKIFTPILHQLKSRVVPAEGEN